MTALETDAICQLRDTVKELWGAIDDMRSDLKAIQLRQATEDGAKLQREKWSPVVTAVIASVITLLGGWALRHLH